MVNSGLRKIKKKDPVQAAAIQTLPELSGAIFNFGRIKSGKTAAMMTIAQAYHDHPARNYKVFDIWGGDRNEHLYWTLPSNKKNYWAKVQKALRMDKAGPKQYKVNLLYPVLGKVRKKLPNNEFVKSKLFTIPFEDIKLEDLALIIGSPSMRDEALWKDIQFDCKGFNIPQLLAYIERKKGVTYTIYRSAIQPLCRGNLFQKKGHYLNLDLKEELKDQKTVSVLCLDFVDKEYKLFVAGYILRKMADELDKRRIKIILPFREASEIFRVSDASIVPDRVKVFKSYLSQWIRMGRRGMHFLLDTQSPNETRGLVSGQQDMTLLGRLPSQADREAATEQLYRDNLITKKQITAIGSLEPGQFIVCPSGKHAYFQYFFLPKSRFWEEGSGNFYTSVWKNTVDKWINVEEDLKKLKQERLIEQGEVNERKQMIKALSDDENDVHDYPEDDKPIPTTRSVYEEMQAKKDAIKMSEVIKVVNKLKPKKRKSKSPVLTFKPDKIKDGEDDLID